MSVALLIILLALFIARVFGQLVVALRAPRWLPPMEAWYSGLMPYRYLLPSQIAIIVLMMAMIRQVANGVPANRGLAIGVFAFATAYALGMVVRFFVSSKGRIPIVFHWVLAAFLFTYAFARL
ncbi:MAG TPA: hypothetical protein VEK79_12960 [Thermoanaerobaculia bacterium]|nr:hypothetical protein [Thermoanaerobaculia bacterium]